MLSTLSDKPTHHNTISSMPMLDGEAVSKPETVLIMGGGSGGCATAITLAEVGFKVILLERHTLLSGTSDRTPGRMGLGFHYVDKATAVMYLRATVNVAKRYPGMRIGESLAWSHPYRHGRYFITKDSQVSPEKILATYEHLQAVYTALVQEDPSNQVFGPPEQFFRILKPSEYESDVNKDKVVLGVETAEHLLNWPKLKEHLLADIQRMDGITVHEGHNVVAVQRGGYGEPRFILTVETTQPGCEAHEYTAPHTRRTFSADYVINATWDQIALLSEQAGFPLPPNARTNRLKVLARIKLPDALKNKHSMFFCMGPFCMFSNTGDGYGYTTYAPVSNVENSTSLDISANMERLMHEGPTPDEEKHYTAAILEGVAGYIPAMKDASIVKLEFGIVQTQGTVDIFDPQSDVHKRHYAIEAQQVGWWDSPTMKLLLLLDNAQILLAAVKDHIAATQAINRRALRIASTLSGSKKTVQFLIKQLLEKYLPHDHLEQDALALASTIKRKARMHAQFTDLKSDALRARSAVITRSTAGSSTASRPPEAHDEVKLSDSLNPTSKP